MSEREQARVCPTCGSDDPAICRLGFAAVPTMAGAMVFHNHGIYRDCCPNPFHTPAPPEQQGEAWLRRDIRRRLQREHGAEVERVAILAAGAILEGVAAGYEQEPAEVRFSAAEVAAHLREVAGQVPAELAKALHPEL